VRYKVYGDNKKNVPNVATNFKGKYFGPDRLHADGIKKMAIKGGKYEMRNLGGTKLLGEDTICFLLRRRKVPFQNDNLLQNERWFF
jgi:hypothetical protein